MEIIYYTCSDSNVKRHVDVSKHDLCLRPGVGIFIYRDFMSGLFLFTIPDQPILWPLVDYDGLKNVCMYRDALTTQL